MGLFQKLFGIKSSIDIKSLIAEGAFLLDVITSCEFASGHLKESVNIPLDRVASQIEKFKNKKNIIVFCRSGIRSGQAKKILQQNGISNVFNGGTWEQVNKFIK